MAGYEQQDAHEFFMALLDALHSSCGGMMIGSRFVIVMLMDAPFLQAQRVYANVLFIRLFRESCNRVRFLPSSSNITIAIAITIPVFPGVTCLKCKSVSTAVDPIFDISLDLKSESPALLHTLLECLERYIRASVCVCVCKISHICFCVGSLIPKLCRINSCVERVRVTKNL